MYGGAVGYRQAGRLFDLDGAATVGVQTRVDRIHARLGPQVMRNPLGTTTDSEIVEASYAPFVKLEVQPLPWVRLAGGVRSEVFTFDVRNRCATCAVQPSGSSRSGLVLPKANVTLGPWHRTEFLLTTGKDFTATTHGRQWRWRPPRSHGPRVTKSA